MESQTLLTVVQQYIGFGDGDAGVLRELCVHARPHFARIVDHFYDCIALDPEASAVMEDAAQVERLKGSLRDWLETGMAGPHDEAFARRFEEVMKKHNSANYVSA